LWPYQADAQTAFNTAFMGDEKGESVAEGSPLDQANKACGATLAVTVEFADMSNEGWPTNPGDYCSAMVRAIQALCDDPGEGWKKGVQKAIQKIDCRFDGKYPWPEKGDDANAAKQVALEAKDIQLKNGVLIYHMMPGHKNIDAFTAAALEREFQSVRLDDGLSVFQEAAKTLFKKNPHNRTGPDDLANANAACGTEMTMDLDWAHLSKKDFSKGPDEANSLCETVTIDALVQACGQDGWKPAIKNAIRKIECRPDGKHPGDPTAESQDMQVKDGVFIYHMRTDHLNTNDAALAALKRDLKL
jgi:hypothetical protein